MRKEIELSNLANKNTGYPVKFQIFGTCILKYYFFIKVSDLTSYFLFYLAILE
jgi:hypothetical protein